jgi:hypothetical protein
MKFIIFIKQFNYQSGGIVVLFNLAKNLIKYKQIVKIYDSSKSCKKNHICNEYYQNNFPLDDDCIVIYPEIVKDNPLKLKKVIRWILAPVGQNSNKSIVDTWGKNDLVYYFNHEEKNSTNTRFYKMLNCLYLNKNIKMYNFKKRSGYCFTYRKAKKFHNNGFELIHPKNSVEIKKNTTQDEYIKIFNSKKYFICYDSNTFLVVIAALCGCVPIIVPVKGISKEEWVKTTAAYQYLQKNNIERLYGIAYGLLEKRWARRTLPLVKEQWNNIFDFNEKSLFQSFLNNMKDFELNENTVYNNYFLE